MTADASAAPSMIDWDAAVATAARLVKPGPKVTPDEARAVVADLRRLALEAEDHVRAFTGLVSVGDPGRVMVVDRPGWAAANVQGFRVLLEPVVAKLAARKGQPGPLTRAVGAKVSGAQIGVILSYLAGKILGQYEIFLPAGAGQGRLTLVAPNIVAAERGMGVDPHDFRLWVCLHEVTHKAQFTAVPWMRDHLQSEIAAYLDATELDPAAVVKRMLKAVGNLAEAIRGDESVSLVEAVQTPEQRVILDRLSAVMTLLEGHAEYVMDAVGPQVVPSVAKIRKVFDSRRKTMTPFDRAVRQLLGLDAKMRQYAEGHVFVRTVVEQVGMERFNEIWSSPGTLPSKTDITDPAAWIERVLGDRPVVEDSY
ncbi:zinc-dependent metalloprotease [Acidothermaceae bacterium B102]|nr:zinc-dependent metalloprotease [Acidothermaceae bacterium B102]